MVPILVIREGIAAPQSNQHLVLAFFMILAIMINVSSISLCF